MSHHKSKWTAWHAHCTVERMESRRMLAASVTGVLSVTGTKASDTIVVALNDTDDTKLDVSVNSVVNTFDLENIESLEIIGLEGHDSIQIDDSNGEVGLEAFLSGGHGNDTLTGSAGDETISGANGEDVLDGGAGDDECEGGRGVDDITGGEGEDVFKSSDAVEERNDLTDEEDGLQIDRSAAPTPVQTRINQFTATPGTKLTGLFQETDDGQTVFEAEFDQSRFARSVKIFSNGVVLEDESELETDALPPRVRNAIFALYPDAEIEEAELLLIQRRTLYEVEIVTGDEAREIILTPRGRVVADEPA